MSFLRETNGLHARQIYLWSDEARLHLWNSDGCDNWDDSLWACREEDDARHSGYENASGVSIPQETMDEYVVMRLAQIVEDGKVKETLERAKSKWDGSGGCQALKKRANALEAVLTNIAASDKNAGDETS